MAGAIGGRRTGFGLESLEARVLMAADPITPDHPFWTIGEGSAVIDGDLDDPDWANAYSIIRTQAWRDDGHAVIRLMYDSNGLYLSAEVDDENVWADGLGSGSGNRWEVESDDSITFYFDPNNSRDQYFQDSDRAFGVNLGAMDGGVNGSGAVRRWKYVEGNGAGGAPDVNGGGIVHTGTLWASSIQGTVNNSSDTDGGWVTEVFLPWAALSMSTPTHGDTIGMNFDLIFDNDGGDRNFVDQRDGPDRFTQPAFVDDHILGAHSSYHSSQAGIRGPINYAEVMFASSATALRPAAVSNLSVSNVGAFGGLLEFTAPRGTTTSKGHVSGYEVRYSTSSINSANFAGATLFEQSYVPRLAGLSERIHISQLAASTTYYVALRALDAEGRGGSISNVVSFTTSASASPADNGRVIVAPGGSGLMFENGDPFFVVGEHLGMSWGYFRNLFPGNIWDPNGSQYINYNASPSFEGEVGPHLDLLASKGVNTLRVFLEILDQDQTGNPSTPEGRYWLEYGAGTFNPAMKQFILNTLEAAATRGIYVIFSPFDTFTYDDVFQEETPFFTGNGGPLSDINDFYQTPAVMDMAKARIDTLVSWVDESPYKNFLLGYEPMNEWDSYEWTLNSEGDADPGRETEMRRRAAWINELNQYVRDAAPDQLIFSSTTARDPRGPIARALFYSRTFDVLAPHLYTNSNEEPINNPQGNTSVLPAVDNAMLTTYWLTHSEAGRPLLNGEWGFTRIDWPSGTPGYSASFTQAEDEALFRTVSWSGVATGQLGQGLRIATDELGFNYGSLTDGMRAVQNAMSSFFAYVGANVDLTNYAGRPIAGDIEATSASKSLLAWGSSDGQTGFAYVLQNLNSTTGSVADAVLRIEGLEPGMIVTATVWRTTGTITTPLAVLTNQHVIGGELSLSLPSFTHDVMVVFSATQVSRDITIVPTTGDGTALSGITSGQHEMLSFVTAGPGSTTVTLSQLAFDAIATIYDNDGNSLGTATGSGGATFVAGGGYRYFVVTRSQSGAGAGAYRVSIDGPIDNDDHADEHEWENATLLSLNGGDANDTGALEGPGDTDLFMFVAGGTGVASLSASGTDAMFTLYDAEGGAIGSGTSLSFDAVHTTTYYVLVESSSGTGTGSYSFSLSGPDSTNPLASRVGRRVRINAMSDGTVTITGINGDGGAFSILDADSHSTWSGRVISSDGPTPTDLSDTWVDPKDGLVYVATPTAEGLIIYTRASDGSWTWVNLTQALGGTALEGSLTHFITPDLSRHFDGSLVLDGSGNPVYQLPENVRNNVAIAGVDGNGDLVIFYQLRDFDEGPTYWTFKNITQEDLIPTSQEVPQWVGNIVGYATPWNGWNIAGLNSSGEIIAVWTSPSRNYLWATTNLSQSYGTPPLAGGLSVYVNWGINLTGVLSDGSVGVTWWSAQYEEEQRAQNRTQIWAFTNLTQDTNGPAVLPDSLTNYSTPNWASNNIVGVSEQGDVVIYWWTPSNGANYGREWLVDNLSERLPQAETPVGQLSAVAPRDSTYAILGVAEDGDLLGFYWSGTGGWTYANVTQSSALAG